MSIRYRNLKQTARDYRRQGFGICDAVKLAAEHHEPFPHGVEFWRVNPYDKQARDFPMARHFIPGTPWRGGNRWQH